MSGKLILKSKSINIVGVRQKGVSTILLMLQIQPSDVIHKAHSLKAYDIFLKLHISYVFPDALLWVLIGWLDNSHIYCRTDYYHKITIA
jgi:hypothetical protein